MDVPTGRASMPFDMRPPSGPAPSPLLALEGRGGGSCDPAPSPILPLPTTTPSTPPSTPHHNSLHPSLLPPFPPPLPSPSSLHCPLPPSVPRSPPSPLVPPPLSLVRVSAGGAAPGRGPGAGPGPRAQPPREGGARGVLEIRNSRGRMSSIYLLCNAGPRGRCACRHEKEVRVRAQWTRIEEAERRGGGEGTV